MDQKMFCYQCEQTAHCSGCTGASGVCGKSAEVAQLQDELTGALIGVGMGVAFGWVGVMSLPVEGATPVLSVPWLQLVGVCVVAIVSALVASWLPGRRAAKVSPSEALATE